MSILSNFAPMILKSKIRRVLLSALLVTAIVVPLLFIGRASAIFVATDCLPSDVSSGDQVTCTLTFEIGSGERIPIQNLELTVTGPGDVFFHTTFDPFGGSVSKDPEIVSVDLASGRNPSFGYGYGYGYGYGNGFDERLGIGYFFFNAGYGYGYGYGHGYGYGDQFSPNEFQYTIIIDTNGLELGTYQVQGKINTGDLNKPSFDSGDESFTIHDGSDPGTLTPTPIGGTGGGGDGDPTPTPTSVPDSTSNGSVGGTIFGIIIGIIVGLAALLGAGWLLWRRISR